jgi:hypothetical protein
VGRKSKGPKPGEWRHQVENLTAYERVDRALAIYTRVLESGQYRDKQRLCETIRDEDGKVDPAREAAAIQLAVDRQRRHASGIHDVRKGPLTLESGFRLLLHDIDGKYAGDTTRKRDVERYSRVVISVLGAGTLWSDIRHGHYRKLWRHLAHEHRKDSAKYGPAAAEKIVGTLRTATTWMHEEELIEPGTSLPASNWKATMRKEWVEITGAPIAAPRKERYTPAEQQRLWRALPQADPRVHIAVEIGAELRLGQVLRCRRSDVQPFGGFAIGRVVVHGRGRKGGADTVLTMQTRHALTRAMTSGYLADLEAAYQAGGDDYYLIPGGKLRTVHTRRGPRKRVPVERGGAPWGRTALRRAWWHLEELAKVEHREWRKWYGLRRIGTDLGEDIESDERVLNVMGGWTDSATRRKYQEKGRTDVAERARRVRERIRPDVRKRGGEA